MKKIAFYGKGGIGKSTTAANVAAALSLQGRQVCQIGCDPKNDSTRLLLGHICRETVLDKVRTSDIDSIKAEDIVHTGYNGITCVEAGGPEPGVGCAGRGIIVALQLLDKLKAVPPVDVTLYDVLHHFFRRTHESVCCQQHCQRHPTVCLPRFGTAGRYHRQQPQHAGGKRTAESVCGKTEHAPCCVCAAGQNCKRCREPAADGAAVCTGLRAGNGL